MQSRVSTPDEMMLLSREGVVRLLGLSSVWEVSQLVKNGGLPAIKNGRRLWFHRARVLDWWETGKASSEQSEQPTLESLLGLGFGKEARFEITIRRIK